MAERPVIIPTDEEDAAINCGIAEDSDTAVWTEAQFASAVRGLDAGQARVPDRLLRRPKCADQRSGGVSEPLSQP